MIRWFHVVSYTSCWGFAIDEKFNVVEVATVAFSDLFGKNVKDAAVRKWFTDNNLIVSEVKATQCNP